MLCQDNCGSVTPGVLRSFLPHVADVQAFGLGLSYSVTDDDAFKYFAQLPQLSSLDFRYYLVGLFLNHEDKYTQFSLS